MSTISNMKETDVEHLPIVTVRMIMRDKVDSDYIFIEVVRSDNQRVYKIRLYDDGTFTV